MFPARQTDNREDMQPDAKHNHEQQRQEKAWNTDTGRRNRNNKIVDPFVFGKCRNRSQRDSDNHRNNEGNKAQLGCNRHPDRNDIIDASAFALCGYAKVPANCIFHINYILFQYRLVQIVLCHQLFLNRSRDLRIFTGKG